MIDQRRLQAAVRETLLAIGEDPDRPELRETPRRVADSWAQFFEGRKGQTRTLPDENLLGELILIQNIDFVSVCEHHLLPFSGTVHAAYQPTSSILGLSDVTKVVRRACAQLTLQERLTQSIAEDLAEAAGAQGVLVVSQARHGCVSDRGIASTHVRALTIGAVGTLRSGELASALTQLLRTPMSTGS